jgi:hypothetical protein
MSPSPTGASFTGLHPQAVSGRSHNAMGQGLLGAPAESNPLHSFVRWSCVVFATVPWLKESHIVSRE